MHFVHNTISLSSFAPTFFYDFSVRWGGRWCKKSTREKAIRICLIFLNCWIKKLFYQKGKKKLASTCSLINSKFNKYGRNAKFLNKRPLLILTDYSYDPTCLKKRKKVFWYWLQERCCSKMTNNKTLQKKARKVKPLFRNSPPPAPNLARFLA